MIVYRFVKRKFSFFFFFQQSRERRYNRVQDGGDGSSLVGTDQEHFLVRGL